MEKNYFLGSVGMVEAFRETDNGLELAFVSKTLTDSGINTSITADDIRAGQGAPIVTRFYHDASVEITLTDVMFKRAYVEAQLGANFESIGEAYQSENLECKAEGKLQLSSQPLEIGSGCSEVSRIAVWYTEAGKTDWQMATATAGNKEITGQFVLGKDYCVRYLALDNRAQVANIMADIIPEELHLIITVPLYAGDSCGASGGKTAGEVQFDIPRFRLNGSQDFAAAMSSNQTMSLAGSALASQKGCDTSAILYTMRVKYNNENFLGELKALQDDAAADKVGDQPKIYGVKKNDEIVLLKNEWLDFLPAENYDAAADEWKAAGTVTVKLKEKPSLTVSVAVTAE